MWLVRLPTKALAGRDHLKGRIKRQKIATIELRIHSDGFQSHAAEDMPRTRVSCRKWICLQKDAKGVVHSWWFPLSNPAMGNQFLMQLKRGKTLHSIQQHQNGHPNIYVRRGRSSSKAPVFTFMFRGRVTWGGYVVSYIPDTTHGTAIYAAPH